MGIDSAIMRVNAFTREYILTVFDGEKKETLKDSFDDLDEWQDIEFFGLLFRIHIDYDECFSVAIYREYTGEDNPTSDATYTDYNNWINPAITTVLTDEEFEQYNK